MDEPFDEEGWDMLLVEEHRCPLCGAKPESITPVAQGELIVVRCESGHYSAKVVEEDNDDTG